METDNFDNYVERGIEACKEGISKAAAKQPVHIMPSFSDILKNKTPGTHPVIQNSGKEFVSKIVEKISGSQEDDRDSQMPSLDLGQQILAQQRKVAAMKRKSPLSPNDSVKVEKQVRQSAVNISFISSAPASPQQIIIADIVAKEILTLTSAR